MASNLVLFRAYLVLCMFTIVIFSEKFKRDMCMCFKMYSLILVVREIQICDLSLIIVDEYPKFCC